MPCFGSYTQQCQANEVRARALIARMGTKYLCHPTNHIKRKNPT